MNKHKYSAEYKGRKFVSNDGIKWIDSDDITVPSSHPISKALTSLIQKDLTTEKHKVFLSKTKMPYKGTISNSHKKHRVTHCYNCKNKLDNMINIECRACGWIICNCGACGCGYDR